MRSPTECDDRAAGIGVSEGAPPTFPAPGKRDARARGRMPRWLKRAGPLWVAVAWTFYLALNVLVIRLRRPPVDDREIERELKRITRHLHA